MTDCLLDADAFLCIRKLGLLALHTRRAVADFRFVMTGFIARNELNDVSAEIDDLLDREWLRIESIPARKTTPTGKLYWDLQRGKSRIHKGEAEAIVWAYLVAQTSPIFISNDSAARRMAKTLGVRCGDVFDFVVLAVEHKVITVAEAKQCLEPWDDKHQVLCRPSDYVSFDQTRESRAESRA